MNEALLERKLQGLTTSYKNLNKESLDRFAAIVRGLDDWGLRRINPIELAKKHHFSAHEITDILICASRAGIFDIAWNLICPFCGSVLISQQSIEQLNEDTHHCNVCDVDVPLQMDDYIEVTFDINPDIHRPNLNPFTDFDAFQRYFFSQNFIPSAAALAYFQNQKTPFVFIPPDEKSTEFEAELLPDRIYRLICYNLHTSCSVKIEGSPSQTEQQLDLTALPQGFDITHYTMTPGKVRFTVHNQSGSAMGVRLLWVQPEIAMGLFRSDPPVLLPFLTGKMTLNNQTFRELFKIQNLMTNLKLNVRSLTVLFTDLKGSTELYENIGDVVAYTLIQKHFEILGESVQKYSGAIIKTMGDAIMATFSDPISGVNAAIDMMNNIRKVRLNNQPELGLKVGLHEGPALAINNEGKLDYFGQTINIAARVQGLAQAGEIWVTEPVYAAEGIGDILQSSSLKDERHSVALKGIGQPTTVYKCYA